MLETAVASMVFALVGTAVLAGLSTSTKTGGKTEEQSIAENIARNQMEFLFSEPYREPNQTAYPTITPPAGYTVSTVAVTW